MQVDYSLIVDAVREPVVTAIPFVVFGVVFLLAMKWLGHLIAGSEKRGRGGDRWRKRGRDNVRHFQPRHQDALSRQPDAADQLRTVMTADFTAQPLLNQNEARLFKAIDQQVLEARPDWQVMAQVSLGEILRCKDADAYRCINSKRVDHVANQHRLGDGAFAP